MNVRALTLAALLVAAGCGQAVSQPSTVADWASRVSVAFTRPERFADVRGSCFGPGDQSGPILAELVRFIRETGQRYLPDGASLTVTVTEIDLAGEHEPPVRLGQRCEVRTYRDVYPPRIDLEFQLTDAEGRAVRGGRRALRDSQYLTHVVLPPDDRLRYEKRLLHEWLREELTNRASESAPRGDAP
jgi:hypothetical protein